MIVDELVTILGIEVAASALPDITKFNSKLSTVIRYAEGVATAATAAGVAIFAFVDRMSGSAADIAKFSQYTGMSTASIQKWSFAVEQAGGHAAGIKGDLVNLEKALNPLMPGRWNEGLFMMFGSGYKNIKNAEDALVKISGRMQGMTTQRQLQWGEILGLTPDTMMLMQQGPGAIQKYFHDIQGSLLSADQTKRAWQFEKEMNKLKMTFYKTGEDIVTKLLPGIIRLLDKFDHWLGKNQELISSGLDRFIHGVAMGFTEFFNGLSSLDKYLPVAKNFFGLLMDERLVGGAVLTALTGISAVLSIIALKYVAIGATILAVIAAVEEFQSSNKLDANGEVKDTLINRIHKWIYDKMPHDPNVKPGEEPYYAHPIGKSKSLAAGFKDVLASGQLWDMVTGKYVPIDAKTAHDIKANGQYAERNGGPVAPVTNNNTVNVYGQSDPYSTANEAVNRLRDLTGADFQSRTVSGYGQ